MDTLEVNIKMCEKATEIQNLAPDVWDKARTGVYNHNADFIQVQRDKDKVSSAVAKHFASEVNFVSFTTNERKYQYSLYYIWLPRQDQLQKMVGGFEAGLIDWFHWRNAVYPYMQNPFEKRRFTSYEQLWLAFVMHELYQKTWNGENWIK